MIVVGVGVVGSIRELFFKKEKITDRAERFLTDRNLF